MKNRGEETSFTPAGAMLPEHEKYDRHVTRYGKARITLSCIENATLKTQHLRDATMLRSLETTTTRKNARGLVGVSATRGVWHDTLRTHTNP